MATNTNNLNLVLPAYSDSADVSVLNSNFQKIDNAFGSGGLVGPQGPAGYSPTITVTDITGGHRVTITDQSGTKSIDIMNGSVDFNQQLNTTSNVRFASVTADVVYGAVFME